MKIKLGQAYSFQQLGRRANQEDSRWPECDQPSPYQRFFIVCDGVGGSEGGEFASQTVCQSLAESLSSYDFCNDFSNGDFRNCLDYTYDSLDKRAKETGLRDMSTTLTVAVFHGGGCTLAHIGDSRIYQVRPSVGIIYRSNDHSLVNQMVHSGIITPKEAERHPQRNVITRYMSPVTVDQSRCMATVMRTKDVKAGDYFLLCTDGVLQGISEDHMVEVLSNCQSDENKVHEISKCCVDSNDNNTAYLLRIKDVEYDKDVTPIDIPIDSSETRKNRIDNQVIEEIESVKQEVESAKTISNGSVVFNWLKKIISK